MQSQTSEHNHEPIDIAIDILAHNKPIPKIYHLFVYGTLRRGCYNHKRFGMDIEGKYIRKDILSGFKLVHAQYPFMIPTGDDNDVVLGELYTISEAYKWRLDSIEQGYDLKEVSKGIYAYIPSGRMIRSLGDFTHEVPTNKDGYYDWSPEMELEVYKKYFPNSLKHIEEMHDEQQ